MSFNEVGNQKEVLVRFQVRFSQKTKGQYSGNPSQGMSDSNRQANQATMHQTV